MLSQENEICVAANASEPTIIFTFKLSRSRTINYAYNIMWLEISLFEFKKAYS